MKHARRVLLAVALLSLSCGGRAPSGILLITIDTCRADRIGCYGGKVETPAIDGVAERGALFLQAWAPVPLTLPSHCTMMTGLYPDRHTVHDNGEARLPREALTLAEVLREKGWSTAAFVSAFPLAGEFGCDQGFEIYDDSLTANASGARAPRTRQGEAKNIAERLYYDERLAGDVAAASLPWLRNALNARKPFFLWVHFFDPHAAYRAPEPFASKYGTGSYEGKLPMSTTRSAESWKRFARRGIESPS
jgi:arylsulfatase A-like enzyme